MIVGGTLETFMTMNEVLAGATMGCVICEHYKNTMGGDAYYYLHETNPYPFTSEQLKAVWIGAYVVQKWQH